MKLLLLAAVAAAICLPCRSTGQSMWVQKANYGAGAANEARAFAIGSKGYLGAATPDFWEYDPAADAWTQKASFIAGNRPSAAAFAIGNKGYFGTGDGFGDFYEYDALTNTWTQKANFGGAGREGAVGCTTGGKGYIGLGGSYFSDWWEYDPVTDAWTQKANLAGGARYHAGAFAIGGMAYVSCGFDGNFFNDLWEYDPAGNAWTAKASIPGPPLDRPVGLAVGNKGYIVTGWTGGTALASAWEWDQPTNTWSAIPDFGGAPRYNACGFVIGTMLYVGTGYAGGPAADVWAYGNSCNVLTSSTTTSCAGNCDGTATVDFPDPGAALGYQWSTGDTTQSVSSLCAGIYTVSVTDTAGCNTTVTVLVADPAAVTATFAATPPTCNGAADGMLCATPVGGIPPYTAYLWSTGDTTACTQPVPAGTYTVTITDSSGCSGTATDMLADPPAINMSFLATNATCQTCPNGSASANVSGGAVPYSYNWSNGGTLVFIANLLPGTYTCCVTDANGCTQCDSTIIGYPMGIGERELPSGVTVQPNPFREGFTVATDWSPAALARAGFRLYDVTGRQVPVKAYVENSALHIEMNGDDAGVYVGCLESQGISWYFRVARY